MRTGLLGQSCAFAEPNGTHRPTNALTTVTAARRSRARAIARDPAVLAAPLPALPEVFSEPKTNIWDFRNRPDFVERLPEKVYRRHHNATTLPGWFAG
jgi:hypothetical protein